MLVGELTAPDWVSALVELFFEMLLLGITSLVVGGVSTMNPARVRLTDFV